MKKKVQNAKTNNLLARPKGGKVININKSNKLIYEQNIVKLPMKKY